MPVSDNNDIKRFKWEYSQFLSFVQQRKPQRAMIYAKTLGIDRRTLNKWMAQDELRDAMANAVDEILDQMQKSGEDDWRMWSRMLELAGVDTEHKVDVTTDGESVNPLQGLTTEELRKLANK